MRRLPLQSFGIICALGFIALCVGGCAARPKTYPAPDFKKVDAGSKRLAAAHQAAAATTDRAETKLAAAQKNADTIAGHSVTMVNLVDELSALAPLELRPRFAELKAALQAEQSETGELVTNLSGAQTEIGWLKHKDLPEAAAAKAATDAAVAEVKKSSGETASAATNESLRRYKAESQLIQQRIFKWVLWIGVPLILVVVILLFFAGKLSFAGIRGWFRI